MWTQHFFTRLDRRIWSKLDRICPNKEGAFPKNPLITPIGLENIPSDIRIDVIRRFCFLPHLASSKSCQDRDQRERSKQNWPNNVVKRFFFTSYSLIPSFDATLFSERSLMPRSWPIRLKPDWAYPGPGTFFPFYRFTDPLPRQIPK